MATNTEQQPEAEAKTELEVELELRTELEIVILFTKSDNIQDREVAAIFAADTQTPGHLSANYDAISLTADQVEQLLSVYRKQCSTNWHKAQKQVEHDNQVYANGVLAGKYPSLASL